MNPSDILEFKVSYLPQDRAPRNITAYLYLYNLPKESIINNSATKKINGV